MKVPGTLTELPFTVNVAEPLSWELASTVPYVRFTALTDTFGVAIATLTDVADCTLV